MRGGSLCKSGLAAVARRRGAAACAIGGSSSSSSGSVCGKVGGGTEAERLLSAAAASLLECQASTWKHSAAASAAGLSRLAATEVVATTVVARAPTAATAGGGGGGAASSLSWYLRNGDSKLLQQQQQQRWQTVTRHAAPAAAATISAAVVAGASTAGALSSCRCSSSQAAVLMFRLRTAPASTAYFHQATAAATAAAAGTRVVRGVRQLATQTSAQPSTGAAAASAAAAAAAGSAAAFSTTASGAAGAVSAEGAAALMQAASASGVTAAAAGATRASRERSILASVAHYGRCYYEISKTRLSLMVAATAAAGFVMGSGDVVDWAQCGWTTLGTLMAAASANSFNQAMEVASDSRMKRTLKRPLPSGRISVPHALAWAVFVGSSGVVLLDAKTNSTAAALAGGNIGLYALVYTPLKQLHPVNTWVGAVVGAIPPLLGWAAASGGSLDAGAWVWAGVLYFWQLPHFLALAWMCRNDYVQGGYRMLSAAAYDGSGRRTAAAALRNCVYLLPLGALAYGAGMTTLPFAIESTALSAAMLATAVPFLRSPSTATARRVFLASLLYLPSFMAAMMLHRLPNLKLQVADSTHGLIANTTDVATTLACTSTGRDGFGPGSKDKGLQDDLRGCLLGDVLHRKQEVERRPLPPAAYFSAAPFPFLPVPQ